MVYLGGGNGVFKKKDAVSDGNVLTFNALKLSNLLSFKARGTHTEKMIQLLLGTPLNDINMEVVP